MVILIYYKWSFTLVIHWSSTVHAIDYREMMGKKRKWVKLNHIYLCSFHRGIGLLDCVRISNPKIGCRSSYFDPIWFNFTYLDRFWSVSSPLPKLYSPLVDAIQHIRKEDPIFRVLIAKKSKRNSNWKQKKMCWIKIVDFNLDSYNLKRKWLINLRGSKLWYLYYHYRNSDSVPNTKIKEDASISS